MVKNLLLFTSLSLGVYGTGQKFGLIVARSKFPYQKGNSFCITSPDDKLGSKLRMTRCAWGEDSQLWRYNEASGFIENFRNGLRIDVPGGDGKLGNGLQQWERTGHGGKELNNMVFKYDERSATFTWTASNGKVFAIDDSPTDGSAAPHGWYDIHLWSPHDGPNQQFDFFEPNHFKPRHVFLVNGNDKDGKPMCMTSSVDRKGQYARVAECNGSQDQIFEYDQVDGRIWQKGRSALVLDVLYGENWEGSSLHLNNLDRWSDESSRFDYNAWTNVLYWRKHPEKAVTAKPDGTVVIYTQSKAREEPLPKNGLTDVSESQKWFLHDVDYSTDHVKTVMIRSRRHDRLDQCMTVPNNKVGDDIVMQKCTGADTQIWTYNPKTGGIKNKANNLLLDVTSGQARYGTRIQQWYSVPRGDVEHPNMRFKYQNGMLLWLGPDGQGRDGLVIDYYVGANGLDLRQGKGGGDQLWAFIEIEAGPQVDKKVYTVVTDRAEYWSKAKEICEGRGMELASVMNKNEDALLKEALEKAAPRVTNGKTSRGFDVWLGGTIGKDGWEWASGEAMEFTAWDIGEPTSVRAANKRLCFVVTVGKGRWHDCTPQWKKLHFVCQGRFATRVGEGDYDEAVIDEAVNDDEAVHDDEAVNDDISEAAYDEAVDDEAVPEQAVYDEANNEWAVNDEAVIGARRRLESLEAL